MTGIAASQEVRWGVGGRGSRSKSVGGEPTPRYEGGEPRRPAVARLRGGNPQAVRAAGTPPCRCQSEGGTLDTPYKAAEKEVSQRFGLARCGLPGAARQLWGAVLPLLVRGRERL